MKRFVILGTIGGALMFSSCATISISGEAQLAPKSAVCRKVNQKQIWFLLGLFPLGDNSTDDIIPKGKKVRVETKFTLTDFAIEFLTSGFLTSRTAEVYVCE